MVVTETDRDLPLADITVVELRNLIAAPFMTPMLGDLGADVIKVERPKTGDVIRQTGDFSTALFAALNPTSAAFRSTSSAMPVETPTENSSERRTSSSSRTFAPG